MRGREKREEEETDRGRVGLTWGERERETEGGISKNKE